MKTPVWIVKDVEPMSNYTLLLSFADGSRKLYNASPLLEMPIYSKLKNIAFFMKAKAECGTVVWDDDVDIAPEHLYECSHALEA